MNKEKNEMNRMVENLKALRPMLPTGYTKIIGKKMGVSAMAVSNALQGKTRRYDIIECAIELAEEGKKVERKLNEFINK